MSTEILPGDQSSAVPPAGELSTTQLTTNVEVLDPEWEGPRCEKCAAPIPAGQTSVCKNCGWYASVGIFVEIDSDWEEAAQPPAPTDAEAVPEVSHLEVWLNLLPSWAWLLIASAFVIVFESILARLITPAESYARMYWSLGQLAIGFLLFVTCHVVNFMILAADDAELNVLDVLLKPLKVWGCVFAEMPRRQWLVNAGVMGLAAVIMSFLVIGGIPYERLWDWGFEPPPKKDLFGAIVKQAQKIEGKDRNLEDLANELTGEGDDKPKAKPRINADCVIIGYRANEEGLLHTLILATEFKGKLVYAGLVTPTISRKDADRLYGKLKKIRTHSSFLRLQMNGNWVEPKLTCRITYSERTKYGRFEDPRWGRMLDTIEFDFN